MTRAAVLLACLLLGVLATGAAAAPPDPRVVEVEVSEHGFNGDPGAVLTVEEGELVELVFLYGDGHLPDDNPHIITIEGMDLETERLSRDNPRTALRLRAEKTGTYNLQCKITCTGHDRLQGARLRVVGAGALAAGIEPENTVMTATSIPPGQPGAEAVARARVTTEAGVPLEGVMVEFGVRTTFVISDWLVVGWARTDANGEAELRFLPNRGGDQTLRARYPGSTRYIGAEQAINLAVPEYEPSYDSAHRPLIPGLGFWLLWLVVGSIWATFLIVFYHLRQLAADR